LFYRNYSILNLIKNFSSQKSELIFVPIILKVPIVPKKLKTAELGRLSLVEFKKKEKNKVVIVLDNIRSMHNVGSIFRTSDAFAVEKIYLCGITGRPPHREIRKTAIGAEKSVDWKYFENTIMAIQELKNSGYTICSVEQVKNSRTLSKNNLAALPLCLVFGNEVEGVDSAILSLSDHCVEIPQFGTKHSFNVSVSVALVLWELLRN